MLDFLLSLHDIILERKTTLMNISQTIFAIQNSIVPKMFAIYLLEFSFHFYITGRQLSKYRGVASLLDTLPNSSNDHHEI